MIEAPYGHSHRPTPTVHEYLSGLRRMIPTGTRLKMLGANLHAPDYAISATEMARRVFSCSWHGIANIQYGSLASALALKMRMPIPKGHYALTFVVRIGTRSTGELEWVLHPSVVQALRLYGVR
jgi:hypothetical protein